MDPSLRDALEALHGSPVTAVDPAGSSSFHRTAVVALADGRRRFVKWSSGPGSTGAPASEVFEAEADGLESLAEPGILRLPADPQAGRVEAGAAGGSGTVFLAMEAIAARRTADDRLYERLGRQLAEHHRATAIRPDEAPDSAPAPFGHRRDNYLGATPQPNPPADDWVEFFREHRLGHQLALARRSGTADNRLQRLGGRLLDRLGEWIDLPEEPGCLLHGDLWGGNHLVDGDGEPVLVDPAVHRGHREAELAMTTLFSGYPATFHAAYREAWPLPDGAPEREPIYHLYHLLNHLNLFGGGYRGRCLAILERLVG